MRIGSESRLAAWLAALATGLLSPSFLLLAPIRRDSGFWIPQRLHALMSYGEGPHIAALCVLPGALAAAFLALRKSRPIPLAAAGALCALVVANNFYGATALAILYPIMVWSVWNGERSSGVLLRAATIPAIAYGLSAFWFTPSYVRITLIDLNWVSMPGNIFSKMALVAVVALFCYLTRRLAGGCRDREWPIFVTGAAMFLSLYVLGFYAFGFRVTGEPARLIPELDFVLILATVEVLRLFWYRPRGSRVRRVALVLLAVLAFSPSIRYLRHAWTPFPKVAPVENVYEYRTTQWIHDHLPGQRVLPTGSVRFWFDAWTDNAQPDGGSDQGMLNQRLPDATFQILHGDRGDLAALWLQALGTDAVVVDDKTSLNAYHDFGRPEKFRDVARPIYDDAHGTIIYQVPRVHPGLARLVDSAKIAALQPIHGGDDADGLMKYVAAVEDPARHEATSTWRGFDEVDIQSNSKPGESVLLQETWDPAWHAYENGKELPLHVEPIMDFMLIDVPEGAHNIQMRFETPPENRFGQVLFVITALGVFIYSASASNRASNRG